MPKLRAMWAGWLENVLHCQSPCTGSDSGVTKRLCAAQLKNRLAACKLSR